MITVGRETIIVLEDIPQFYKISLADIPAGRDVYKYGGVIGKATKDIRKGNWPVAIWFTCFERQVQEN